MLKITLATTVCCWPVLNKYSARELLTAGNIWQFVGQNASPARSFMYNHQVVTCQKGVQSLSRDWQAAIDQAAGHYAARLFPHNAQAKIQLLQYLPISYGFLTHLSEDASSIIQQNMMANALQNGILGWSARSNAPAALESYAFNKAQQQNRVGNRTIGAMAAYWLPLLKNVLEGTLYGAFVFVFLLLIFPFGFQVLKHYTFALIWLQLWAPLYAVINLYASYYAQQHSLAASLSNGAHVLSLSTQSGLMQVNMDMAGLAGYISLSVPALAWMLLKGASGMLQLTHYVGGMLQSSATASSTESASGSMSLANTQFSTHSAFNTSANHFDTSAKTFNEEST